MNRQQANAALAGLSPEAREVFDSSELDDASPEVIRELSDAGLIEANMSYDWNDRATEIDNGLKPRAAVDELIDHLAEEDFLSAVDTFDQWGEGTLAGYDFDEKAARVIIAEAATSLRATYNAAVEALANLPSNEEAAAA